MKIAILVFIGLVALSTVSYANEQVLDQPALTVEDPYSPSKPSPSPKPKTPKTPTPKTPKTPTPKTPKTPTPKTPKTPTPKTPTTPKSPTTPKTPKTPKAPAAHSSTGSEHGSVPKPAPVTSGLCQVTVKPGDTLSAIGARVGVSWQTIASTNHLSNPNLIHPGQVLSYPCGSAPSPPSPPPSAPPSAPSGGSCRPFADANWNCATAACTSRVSNGAFQPSYQCAEFVARSLASAGLIPGLSSSASQGAYAAWSYGGHTYDLCWTSSRYQNRLGLEDAIKALGWHSSGASTSAIGDCSVVFAESYGHVGVGVGGGLLDAHNVAHQHWPVSNWGSIISTVYNR